MAASMAFSINVLDPTPAMAAATEGSADNMLTSDKVAQLSYLQVKGTGLANRCYDVVGEDSIPVKKGSKIVSMCLEPKKIQVK